MTVKEDVIRRCFMLVHRGATNREYRRWRAMVPATEDATVPVRTVACRLVTHEDCVTLKRLSSSFRYSPAEYRKQRERIDRIVQGMLSGNIEVPAELPMVLRKSHDCAKAGVNTKTEHIHSTPVGVLRGLGNGKWRKLPIRSDY